jgi:hydrogenase maturation factor HypF (carbamoyltransferase family)
MILEYKLEYRSSSLVYERIFLKIVEILGLNAKIMREGSVLKLYVETESTEILENFATHFAEALPHSIFLHQTEAKIIEKMPEGLSTLMPKTKLPLPFCPQCAKEVTDPKDKNFYNLFLSCEVCGYGTQGEARNYRDEIQQAVMAISGGSHVLVQTHYGKYTVGIPSESCKDFSFDLLSYDLATVLKYAHAEEHELSALASFEKPLLTLKTSTVFENDFKIEDRELARFKLPDDMVLYLLMEELHHLGITLLFVTQEEIPSQDSCMIVPATREWSPIEVVVSPKDIAIVSGDKGLPAFPLSEESSLSLSGFYSVIKEHALDDENIIGINLSKTAPNSVLVHGKKYGTIEYLPLNFTFDCMATIFKQIIDSDENGGKIVQNYKKSYPEHFSRITHIVFDDQQFNIYRLWGIVAIVLELTDSEDPTVAAAVLEKNTMTFLGTKGPRIDYKLHNHDGKVHLDPLMTLRTAMSFRLAGVDPLTLSYGVMESFCEFLANEMDQVKQSMDTTAIAVSGSMLENKHLFSKMSQEISINHRVYFNNELPVDGRNLLYGGISLDQ